MPSAVLCRAVGLQFGLQTSALVRVRSGRRLPCRPGRRDTCSQAGRKPVWTDDLSSPVSPLFKAAERDRRRAGKVTNLLTASQNHVPEHDGVVGTYATQALPVIGAK